MNPYEIPVDIRLSGKRDIEHFDDLRAFCVDGSMFRTCPAEGELR